MDPLVRLLVHGACADSYHDFKGKNLGFNTTRVPSEPGLYHVASGIPGSDEIPKGKRPGVSASVDRDVLHDEDELLREMFSGFTDMGTFVGALRTSCAPPSPCIDVQTTIGTINGPLTYTIKTLNKDGESNVKKISSIVTDKDYFNFFKSSDINLLFDAGTIDIISLLKMAVPAGQGVPIQVRRVINRELINDPAPKTYTNDGVKAHPSANMNFGLAFDVQKADITYSKFTSVAPTDFQRDKFFSLLEFRLSNLSPAKGLPTIVAEIFQANGSRVYTTNNPHDNNAITNCIRRIKEMFVKMPKNHIATSAHFQCKRSGDWLQAISCLDTKRLYADTLAGKGAPLSGNKIILVTHDRILLWYALFLGLDVLFTYRIGASADDDDEEVEEDAGSSGSEKILVYFSNDVLSLSPAEIEENNIAKAQALYAEKDVVVREMQNYNEAVLTIKQRRLTKIDTLFARITAEKHKPSITLLVQEYMRFTSIDYTAINIDEITERGEIFNSDPVNANALSYLSLVNNIRNKFISLKFLPSDGIEQLVSKLEISNTAYKSDPLFQNTPVMYTEVRSGGRGDVSISFLKLAQYLGERLPVDMVTKLNDSLEPIRQALGTDKLYYISTFMAHMALELQRAEEPPIEVVKDYENGIKEEVAAIVGSKRQRILEEPAGEMSMAEASARANAESDQAEEVVIAGTMGSDITAAEPNVTVRRPLRAKFNTMFGLGNGIRKMANTIATVVGRKRARMSGGGGDDDYYAYFLFLATMYQLFNDYNALESDENFDYQYYEAYVKVVLAAVRACTQGGQRDYKALVNLLFIEFPKGRWTANIFPNERFGDCVTFVANSNASQCINAISGDFSLLGYSVPIPSIERELATIRKMVKGRSFENRSDWLSTQIAKEISVPYSSMVGAPSSVVRTGRVAQNMPTVYTNTTPAYTTEVYGGKRTTRKYKKSLHAKVSKASKAAKKTRKAKKSRRYQK